MADHRATWASQRELAHERFPNDEIAAEIAAREAFDAEEMATYAADLDGAGRFGGGARVHISPGGAPRGSVEGGPHRR
jgi:hypothetical protein